MYQIPFTLSTVFIMAIISQGLFAVILLLFHKANHKANRYLSGLIFIFILWLFDSFFRVANLYGQNANLYFLPIYFSFAFGPLIYFYTKALTQPQFQFKRNYAWHFLPALLQTSLYVFLSLKGYGYRRWFWLEVHKPFTYDLEFNITLVSLIFYLVLSLRLVAKYQVWIKEHFSEISKIDLRWLRVITILFLLLCATWLVDAILREWFTIYPSNPFSSISIGLCILALGAGALLQGHITKGGTESVQNTKTTTSQVDQILDENLLERIQQEMHSHEYFLNQELTLKEFAEKLNESPRIISEHINKGLKKTFIDFVNEYRVAKVKEQIKSGALVQYTLYGIAMESGFNSKATFNRVFKSTTGMSPSEYQKAHQNED